ncbi:MAG: alpha-amylase family glycosyl hydrolase [Acidobacteriota bacterium]|nr:alpha-amylase family glycosyl hydrolase [Acidobacteriota bacterium]
MSWFETSVFYQIYPLGLCGAPRENDGVLEHRILKLVDDGWIDHLRRLGVSCVILNPVFQSLTHGYDTTDYLTVDCRLGTNADLRRVVDAFHDAGIRVLLDAVFNHVGRDFPAFRDVLESRGGSECSGWFNISWGGNNQYGDGFSYETWAGVPYLVKLNHRNFDLNSYCADVVRSWESEYDIDGLRLDVAYRLDEGFLTFLREVTDELSSKRGEKFLLLGETMFGDYNRWMGERVCDTVTNYEVYKGLESAMNTANMREMAHTLERQGGTDPWDLYTGRHLLNFADNHDVPRIATRLGDKRHLYPLYGLLFGMCGVPCVYYGSEWGIEGEQRYGDHELRPALDAPEWNELTDWISALAAAKRGSEALCWGDYREVMVGSRQLLFERASEHERVLVAINAASEPFDFHLDADYGQAVDLITGTSHDLGAGGGLEPFSARFWRLER